MDRSLVKFQPDGSPVQSYASVVKFGRLHLGNDKKKEGGRSRISDQESDPYGEYFAYLLQDIDLTLRGFKI